jgi:vacuolar-type H+-ATPase subunit H
MADKKDNILIAEEDAKIRIGEVLLEKDNLLRQAKERAKKELKSHDEELRDKTQAKITELNMNSSEVDDIDAKTLVDLKEIENKFTKNKSSVCDFLFNSVVNVTITIPDVVKADFEKQIK